MLIWPLLDLEEKLSKYGSEGCFGAIRKYDIHTGVDLYCENGQKVVAMEDGEVVLIENFTGENAIPKSPWWNETQAVLIEGKSGVICYGEIKPASSLEVCSKVEKGDFIGTVVQVLKEDKGKPMSMLHLELYKKGTRKTVIWELGKEKPENLLDISKFLDALLRYKAFEKMHIKYCSEYIKWIRELSIKLKIWKQFEGFNWIKVKTFKYDEDDSLYNNLVNLIKHHDEESKFLVEEYNVLRQHCIEREIKI